MRFPIALAVLLCLCGSGKAMAAEQIIDFHGFHGEVKLLSPCVISFSIDKTTLYRDMDELKKADIFNRELSQTDLNTKPMQMMFAASLMFGSVGIRTFYESHNDADKCTFLQYAVMPDKYGNDDKMLIATYDFDRALYKKINWTNFETLRLPEVAINFKTTPAAEAKAAEEPQ